LDYKNLKKQKLLLKNEKDFRDRGSGFVVKTIFFASSLLQVLEVRRVNNSSLFKTEDLN